MNYFNYNRGIESTCNNLKTIQYHCRVSYHKLLSLETSVFSRDRRVSSRENHCSAIFGIKLHVQVKLNICTTEKRNDNETMS